MTEVETRYESDNNQIQFGFIYIDLALTNEPEVIMMARKTSLRFDKCSLSAYRHLKPR